MAHTDNKKRALELIVLFGLVSLFGDIIYEGARSINGPYLKLLGVNAATVGLIAGLGEFVGYAIRLLSGYFVDKTRAYWVFTILGYGILASVPLLALAGIWQVAAFFMIMERLGKALRSPAKDTIVSQAAKQVGTGFGFGLQEAMDQIGAFIGPIMFALFFMAGKNSEKTIANYQAGYTMLWIPFILLMVYVLAAYKRVPDPEKLEEALSVNAIHKDDKLSKVFWLYTLFSFLATMGLANFVLMGYHFKKANVLTDSQIPLFYALAMLVDGAAALAIGKFYDVLKGRMKNDNAGLLTLMFIPLFSIILPILAFSNNFYYAALSAVVLGLILAAHETIMKSAIADLTHLRKRGLGYGIFNTVYGVAMFLGSTLMGVLYDKSMPMLIGFVIMLEITAVPVFLLIIKESRAKAL